MQLHFVMTFLIEGEGRKSNAGIWLVYIWKRDSFILGKELFGPFLESLT